MACIINSIKTGHSVKNVHISLFQNPLQTKFSLHISVCQSQIKKNQTFPEILYIWTCLFSQFHTIMLFVLLNLCCRLHFFDGMNNVLTFFQLPIMDRYMNIRRFFYLRFLITCKKVKGQLISKCPFGVIISDKIPTTFF